MPHKQAPVRAFLMSCATAALVVLAVSGAGRAEAPPEPGVPPGGGAPGVGDRPAGRPSGKGGAGPRQRPGGKGGAKAKAEQTDEAGSETKAAAAEVEVTVGDKGVSLFAVSADAHEVFTELGRATNTPIIIDDTVNRKLTLNLTNKTIDDILAEIVTTYGLSAAEVNGIRMISEGIPERASSYLLSDIDSIRTKYVNAANAKNLLPVFLRQHVKLNTEQNAVVLSAPKPVLEKFRQDVAQFDIPAQQIMLGILVVEFTETGMKELGTRLGWANEGLGGYTKAVDDTADPGQAVLRGSRVLPKAFTAELQALVTEGEARVRANPSIATISGNRAEIFIGLQRFLQTPVELSGEGNYRRETRNDVSAGIKLEIIPYTAGEGEILIDLQNAEVSTLGALDPVTRLPDKSIRTAETSVRVWDGETVIIGGLVQSEERRSVRKIPLLGDLPVLGTLFRNESTEVTKTELAIFITPRVLSQTGHLPAEEENALFERFVGPRQGKTAEGDPGQ